MNYSIVLFDLDGTVIDSSEGITSSVAYALDKEGICHEGKDSLKHFIGPPLKEQFMKCYDLDDDKGAQLVDFYREYYGVKGIYQCELYSGMEELIKQLNQSGCTVVLATSKPEKYARIILEHFSLTQYFDFIAGANIDNTRTNKADVITYALESIDAVTNKQDVIMVGDHHADIVGASSCGVDCVYVTYGFGDDDAAKRENPVAVVNSVKALGEFLLG